MFSCVRLVFIFSPSTSVQLYYSFIIQFGSFATACILFSLGHILVDLTSLFSYFKNMKDNYGFKSENYTQRKLTGESERDIRVTQPMVLIQKEIKIRGYKYNHPTMQIIIKINMFWKKCNRIIYTNQASYILISAIWHEKSLLNSLRLISHLWNGIKNCVSLLFPIVIQ